MTEDQQLLKVWQQGENDVWKQIYLKYKDDLLTVARSLVNDINMAEDRLQEAFVMLFSNDCKI